MSFDASVLDRLGLAAWLALSIRATLVLAIGAAGAWLLRRRSAATRHFVWLLTLNAVLGVTAFTTLTRGLAVTVPRWPHWAADERAVPPSFAPRSGVGDVPAPSSIVTHEATGVARGAGVHESAHDATALATEPLATSEPLATEPRATTAPLATRPPATRPAAVVSPGSLLTVLWLAGACLVLGWLALGHVGLARIARRSEPVEDPVWRTQLRRLAHEAGVAHAPRLCSSAAVGAPLVCGLLRPIIIVPVEAGSWGQERRRVVLLHELAHIARRDPLAQSIAWLACATYWFLPLAWLAFTRLRAESERACDDLVLLSGVDAPDYASHLLGVARRARALRLAGSVSLAMARRSTLEGRLLALLDDGVRRGVLGVRARGAGIAALAVVLVALGLVRPVPPAAAVAPAVSSEPGLAAAPAAHPSQAPAAHRAEAIPAEPVAALATHPFAVPAVDPSAAAAADPSAVPAMNPLAAAAADLSAASPPGRVEAGAAVAHSAVETFDVAGDKAGARAEPFHADPQPANLGDTLAIDSKRGAAQTRHTPSSLLNPVLLAMASAPATVHTPAAGTAIWNNRAGGLWSNPANWTPAGVPDAAGESAVLPALSGAYRVTLDVSPKVDAIRIDAGDATLDVNGFSITAAQLVTNSGTIKNFAGVYNSSKIRNLKGGTVSVEPGGTIQVGDAQLWNAGTIVAAKEIHWAGCVLLQGGGTLVLNDTRLLDPSVDQEVTDQFNRILTIASGTTVRGTGVIYKQIVENSGLIQADVAQLPKGKGGEVPPEQVLWFNGSITNRGTIRVMNGGHINVNRPAVDNANGLITSGPGGGSVRLEMPFNTFGTISAMQGTRGAPAPTAGFIRTDGGDLQIGAWQMLDAKIQRGPGGGAVTLNQFVSMQGLVVEAGAELVADWFDSGYNLLTPTTSITNNGTVRLRKLMGVKGEPSSPYHVAIRGTGELVLEDGTIGSGGGGTFVNGAGHTIRGCGTINPPFINEGTVALDCAGGKSARIGGIVMGRSVQPDGSILKPAGSVENRGRISIARGNLSIAGPAEPRYLIEVATPTVVLNKGTISAAGGNITLEKAVTLDNTDGGALLAAGGRVSLGGATGATVIGGRLVAGPDAKAQKAGMLRGGPDFAAAVFQVQKAVTLRDVTIGAATTLATAAGAVTTAAGARVVNEGTNRIAGTFVVSPGTAYFQTTGETLIDGGELLGAIMRGPARGGAGVGMSGATIASGPSTMRFYPRSEARDASFVLELPQAADVEGRVYDAAGREVARIAEGAREAGVYRFALGRSGGAGLPNGIYFGRMVVTKAGVREVLQSRIAVID